MGRVVIGVDPHKRSATIEVVDERERVLGKGRFGTDTRWLQADARRRAGGARSGCGRSRAATVSAGIVAQRLVADGETVVDVPAKLSARARVFSTGKAARPTPTDAHSVAVVALRTTGLRRGARSMTRRWRCGCWSTAATSSAARAP